MDEARKPLTYRRWKRLLTDARTAAGVEVTSHSFRHFAASALISGGASVKQVQTFLGHASAAPETGSMITPILAAGSAIAQKQGTGFTT